MTNSSPFQAEKINQYIVEWLLDYAINAKRQRLRTAASQRSLKLVYYAAIRLYRALDISCYFRGCLFWYSSDHPYVIYRCHRDLPFDILHYGYDKMLLWQAI